VNVNVFIRMYLEYFRWRARLAKASIDLAARGSFRAMTSSGGVAVFRPFGDDALVRSSCQCDTCFDCITCRSAA
jgi:hypothetical protein